MFEATLSIFESESVENRGHLIDDYFDGVCASISEEDLYNVLLILKPGGIELDGRVSASPERKRWPLARMAR